MARRLPAMVINGVTTAIATGAYRQPKISTPRSDIWPGMRRSLDGSSGRRPPSRRSARPAADLPVLERGHASPDIGDRQERCALLRIGLGVHFRPHQPLTASALVSKVRWPQKDRFNHDSPRSLRKAGARDILRCRCLSAAGAPKPRCQRWSEAMRTSDHGQTTMQLGTLANSRRCCDAQEYSL